MVEVVQKLANFDFTDFQELEESDRKLWICSGYPILDKRTSYCAERKAKMFGDRTLQHLKMQNLHFIILCMFLINEIF